VLAFVAVGAPDGLAQQSEIQLDTVGHPTAVSSYGGVTVWSRLEAPPNTYVLRMERAGEVTTLPIPARRMPFDADVGPDATGQPVVVYSRCRQDTDGALPFDRLPTWNLARGCDIYRFRPSDGTVRRLAVASSPTRSEVLPSIWYTRLAFFGVSEPRHGRRRFVARLYTGSLTNRRVRSYPGGTTGPLQRSELEHSRGRVIDGPTPTGIDLGANRVVFGWANLATCTRGDGDSSSGIERASEVWQQTSRSRRRLAHKCMAYGVFGPFLEGSNARWLTQVPGPTVLSSSSSAAPAVDLPSRVYGAAFASDGLITARGNEIGPVQIFRTTGS
jgi:hypothetical protein